MARSRYEDARFEAFDAAKELHRSLSIQERVVSSNRGVGFIDVFEVIEELKIPFAFKPLDKALGFALPYPRQGIVVTTERNLHLQRYTAAHELGHCVLKHEGSIDTEILLRGGDKSERSKDIKEVAAEAFAAEFLLPRWLYIHHMRQQGWSVHGHLQNPEIVYQLSLRLNVSYEATCWGLYNNELIKNRELLNRIRREKPAAIKSSTLGGLDFHAGKNDVWRFTPNDSGHSFGSQEGDFYRFDLPEHASSGYVWNTDQLEECGLNILDDRYIGIDDEVLGSRTDRQIVVNSNRPGSIEVLMSESRPWETNVLSDNVFGVELNRDGAESEGMSSARRKLLGLIPA
jgi:Zn-dependent peptidase ImmA (M78 family)